LFFSCLYQLPKDRTEMHAVLWNWYDNVITLWFISKDDTVGCVSTI